VGLGDAVHAALSSVGVTPDRVERWVGAPCGCAERQDKLNQLGWWAARVVGGKVTKAKEYLEELLR
jgi:hypothetical protein